MSGSRSRGKKYVDPAERHEEKWRSDLVTAPQPQHNGSYNCSRLCTIEDVPDYLKYNRFIKTGYRQPLTAKECCASLFFSHNETVNIYTHGLAGLFFLFWVPYTCHPSAYLSPWLYKMHYFGCISPFIGSTIYHLFMCHQSGSVTYDLLLKFDMCGVWTINAFGGIVAIKATLFCYSALASACIALYSVMAMVLLYLVLTARSAKERFFPLLPFGIVRYAFLALRGMLLWQEMPSGDPTAITYYICMDLAALFGGILNITRFPECFVPIKLDFCLNSHNIMHVLVSLCPILLHWGTMLDFNWIALSKCY